jgi:hypothetical protein
VALPGRTFGPYFAVPGKEKDGIQEKVENLLQAKIRNRFSAFS